METRESSTQRWRFGIFEVDIRNSELRRGGTLVKLREQSFRVLVLLLERAGDIVTREELRQGLWPSDTYVDFDHSLNSAIMKLRDALGDSADKPLYIETIPKRGYRFVAPVSVPLAAPNAVATPASDSVSTAGILETDRFPPAPPDTSPSPRRCPRAGCMAAPSPLRRSCSAPSYSLRWEPWDGFGHAARHPTISMRHRQNSAFRRSPPRQATR